MVRWLGFPSGPSWAGQQVGCSGSAVRASRAATLSTPWPGDGPGLRAAQTCSDPSCHCSSDWQRLNLPEPQSLVSTGSRAKRCLWGSVSSSRWVGPVLVGGGCPILGAAPVSSMLCGSRSLQSKEERRRKCQGPRLPTPWRRSWALAADTALQAHSDPQASRPQPQLMPRGQNRVSGPLVLVGEMSATLLPDLGRELPVPGPESLWPGVQS